MSGDSAAATLWTVGRKRVLSRLTDPSPDDLAEAESSFKKPVLEQYNRESDPYFASARLWDDGILDPVQTRTALILAFAVASKAPLSDDRYGTFRM